MKVGIMTWFSYDNYGSVLQVTALSSVINRRGDEASVINYIPDGKVNNIDEFSIVNKIKDKIVVRIRDNSVVSRISGKQFNDFRRSNLLMSDPVVTQTDLENLANRYDCVVCGSDQIWSPFVFDKHYFLDFVTDSNKKIAYAPSIGTESIVDDAIKEKIEQLTKRFKYLSVREESGAELLRTFGENPKVVVDPTLLFTADDWEAYTSEKGKGEEYVLVYLLKNNKNHLRAAYTIAKQLKVKVKVIPVVKQDLRSKDVVGEGVGPSDFLALIKNAKYVCTDSYHGTIFSILFQKQFCTFERFSSSDKKNQNTRIYNVLSKLELSNRIYHEGKIEALYEEINFEKSHELLETFRTDSLSYLENALNNVAMNEGKNVEVSHVLKNHTLCCGCGACSAKCPVNAIDIERNDEGFYSAYVDEKKCVHCGACNKVCPFQNDPAAEPLWTKKTYSYKDMNKNVLLSSSSGGIGARIAYVLHNRGYNVVGCAYDDESKSAKHYLVHSDTNEERLVAFSNSKYMQSNFADALKEVQSCSDPTVIIGTPCQIAGARKLLNARDNIVYVDLICHGVPTAYLLESYLRYIEFKCGLEKDKISIRFRNKENGWHKKYIKVSDGKREVIVSEDVDPYMQLFDYSLCYGKNCYECRWRDLSAADLRIGDYWGKRFSKDETGVNISICVTSKGEELFEGIAESGIVSETTIDDYFASQQVKNIHEPVFRERLINELKDSCSDIEKISKYYATPYRKHDQQMRSWGAIYGKVKKLIGKV